MQIIHYAICTTWTVASTYYKANYILNQFSDKGEFIWISKHHKADLCPR